MPRELILTVAERLAVPGVPAAQQIISCHPTAVAANGGTILKAWQSTLIALLVIMNVALVLILAHVCYGARASAGTGLGRANSQVIDISEKEYPSLRHQVVYDFDRKTVSFVEINWNGGAIPSNATVQVLQVTNYLKATPEK